MITVKSQWFWREQSGEFQDLTMEVVIRVLTNYVTTTEVSVITETTSTTLTATSTSYVVIPTTKTNTVTYTVTGTSTKTNTVTTTRFVTTQTVTVTHTETKTVPPPIGVTTTTTTTSLAPSFGGGLAIKPLQEVEFRIFADFSLSSGLVYRVVTVTTTLLQTSMITLVGEAFTTITRTIFSTIGIDIEQGVTVMRTTTVNSTVFIDLEKVETITTTTTVLIPPETAATTTSPTITATTATPTMTETPVTETTTTELVKETIAKTVSPTTVIRITLETSPTTVATPTQTQIGTITETTPTIEEQPATTTFTTPMTEIISPQELSQALSKGIDPMLITLLMAGGLIGGIRAVKQKGKPPTKPKGSLPIEKQKEEIPKKEDWYLGAEGFIEELWKLSPADDKTVLFVIDPASGSPQRLIISKKVEVGDLGRLEPTNTPPSKKPLKEGGKIAEKMLDIGMELDIPETEYELKWKTDKEMMLKRKKSVTVSPGSLDSFKVGDLGRFEPTNIQPSKKPPTKP